MFAKRFIAAKPVSVTRLEENEVLTFTIILAALLNNPSLAITERRLLLLVHRAAIIGVRVLWRVHGLAHLLTHLLAHLHVLHAHGHELHIVVVVVARNAAGSRARHRGRSRSRRGSGILLLSRGCNHRSWERSLSHALCKSRAEGSSTGLKSRLDRLIAIALGITQSWVVTPIQITTESVVNSVRGDAAQASVVVVQVLLSMRVGVVAGSADAIGSRSHGRNVVCRVGRLKLRRSSLGVASGRADLRRCILMALKEVHVERVAIGGADADGRGSFVCLRRGGRAMQGIHCQARLRLAVTIKGTPSVSTGIRTWGLRQG